MLAYFTVNMGEKMNSGRLFILLLSLSASESYAAAITNLSREPKAVSYDEWGGEKTVIIPPGRTFRLPGTVAFIYDGRESRIDDEEEYAIWEDGVFGPQRRIRRNSGFGF